MSKKAVPSVGIYCRLSDEDRNKHFKGDDSQSIQNQKSMLLDYAGQKKWNVYKVYSDDDYSGSDRNRPQWNMLLKDCEEGRV
ncbi:MAG: recombinase family protein, partial [Acutalibacteraceae bacterium]